MSKKAYWKEYFECSRCGEISSKRKEECPFCHSPMKNKETHIGGYQPKPYPMSSPPSPPTSGSNIMEDIKSGKGLPPIYYSN